MAHKVMNEKKSRDKDAVSRQRFEEQALPLFDQLYGAAVKLTRRRDQADDLIQQSFLKAYKSFASFKQGTNLRAWLYRIMVNTYISGYRRTKRSPERASVEELGDFVQAGGTPVEESMSYSETLDERMKDAIDQLPKHYRQVLLLSAIDELSYKEIAEVLNIPVGTVMSRLFRAKNMAKESLEKLVFEEVNDMAKSKRGRKILPRPQDAFAGLVARFSGRVVPRIS